MDNIKINDNILDFDGYYNPLFQAALSFSLGLILSPFSLGLFIFIVFYILFEIIYAHLRGFCYTSAEIIIRFVIFLLGVIGFIVGRLLSGDDNPWRMHYDRWDYSDFSSF